VQYVINEDGSISDAHIIRGIDPQLDKEALRIINSMPTWKPGMQDGKPVKTRWNTPVSFTFILPAEEQQPIHNNNEETNE
jgi:protein TonB